MLCHQVHRVESGREKEWNNCAGTQRTGTDTGLSVRGTVRETEGEIEVAWL